MRHASAEGSWSGRDPSAALRINTSDLEVRFASAEGSWSGRRVGHAPKLSIRDWDVIDLGRVREISNFLTRGRGMEARAGDGEREILKLFPIRRLQVVSCDGLRII